MELSEKKAINGAQLKVTFNKTVSASTVIDSTDTLKDGVFAIAAIDSATAFGTTDSLKASLSTDGKTLTIFADAGKAFNGKYAFTVAKEAIKTTASEKLPAYSTVVTAADTTRPELKSVSYKDAATAQLKFSEPVDKTDLTFTAERVDGVALTTAIAASKITVDSVDPSIVNVDLSGLNAADLNKDIKLTLVGLKDYAGNLLTPNPVSTTLKYDTSDTTKAAVTSVTRAGSNDVQIKFDKALTTKPVVQIGAKTVTATNVAIDSEDKTLVNVTLDSTDFPTLPTGLQNVTVSGFKGLNLVEGDSVTKVVNFDVDSAKPLVSSTKVEKIDGVEYLVVTYNEDVKVPNYAAETITGTQLVDSVTTAITPVALKNAATTTANQAEVSLYGVSSSATKSKSIKINLSNVAKSDYTVTLPAGIVVDTFGNAADAKSAVKFSRSVDDKDLAVNTVAAGSSNNEVVVTFAGEVDPATALNKANYTVEGATVEDVILTSNTTNAVAKLTLAKNSNTYDGAHAVTVKNVKSKTGYTIEDTTKSVALNNNVLPTITSAKLVANNQIALTFSKAVESTTVAESPAAVADFVVKVGGVAYAGTLTETMAADGKTATIDLSTALTPEQYASAITIETASGFAITDTTAPYANSMDAFSPITVSK